MSEIHRDQYVDNVFESFGYFNMLNNAKVLLIVYNPLLDNTITLNDFRTTSRGQALSVKFLILIGVLGPQLARLIYISELNDIFVDDYY